jgi:hypothetical protein
MMRSVPEECQRCVRGLALHGWYTGSLDTPWQRVLGGSLQIERRRTRIDSVEAWLDAAPPKGGQRHWVPGRSAYELAAAWCGTGGPCVPPEILALLRSHVDFSQAVIERAFPEHQIPFDGLPGEPRNADLAIEARDQHGIVAITVEGKADESFDRPVSAVLAGAAERIGADQRTGAIRRIEALAAAMLPEWRENLPHLGSLRYQLLTGLAGTIAWARNLGAQRAAFIVHEFVTDATRDEHHARNAADLDAFITRLTSGRFANLLAGTLLGPIPFAGSQHLPVVPLYIGKAQRVMRSPLSPGGQ